MPHTGIKELASAKRFGASAQKVLLHGRVQRALGKTSSEDGVYAMCGKIRLGHFVSLARFA